MLRIKLVRTGKRNAPVFRVAIGEGSRVNEYLGTFNPQMDPPLVQIDKERVKEWVAKGAQLTDAVDQLLKGKYEFQPYVPKQTGAEEEAESPPAAEAESKETSAEEAPAEEKPAEESPAEPEKKDKTEEKPEESKEKPEEKAAE